MSQPAMPPTAAPSSLRWWMPLLLIAATLLVYSSGLTGGFIFDDEPHIQNDTSIRALTPPRYTWLNTRRPFVKLTLAVQYQLHGLNPVGFHVFNVLLHVAAGLTLMGLVRRSLQLPQFAERYARAGPWIAAAVALLWLVHPIQTQAVTYIIQRAESMMSLMMLLSLYCLLRGTSASRWRGMWYALSVAACFVGMGTKEVGVVTPMVALLFDAVVISRSFVLTVKRRWWYYILMFLPFTGVLWLGIGDIAVAGVAAGFGMEHITWKSYLLTQPLVICKYILLLLWPATLSLDHLHPTVDMLHVSPILGLYAWQWAFVLMTVVFIASVIATLRKHWLGFLGLAFFIILGPSSSILPVADVMVEHRVYLVSAIVILLIVLAGDAILRRYAQPAKRRAMIAALCVGVLAAAMGVRTWVRNLDYASSLTIWRATAAASPLNARAWNNLGRSIYDDDPENIDEAIYAYEIAMRLLPDDAEVTAALGTLYAEVGAYEDAERIFKRTLDLNPNDHNIRQRLGVLYMRQNRLAESLEQFKAAVEVAPQDDRSQLSLGILLTRLGRDEDAIAPLRAATTIKPTLGEAWLQLAGIHMRAGNHDAAVDVLKQAAAANASDARLWIALGQSLEQHGQPGDAIDAYRNAIAAEPQALPAYEAMGKLLEDAGDDRAALACYEQAVEAIGSPLSIMRRIAWLHATSADPAVLNGPNALRIMNMLATADVMNQPESLHVLAATQARGGMYEQAINSAHRALAGAEIQGKVELAYEIRRSLASYEAGKPYTRAAR